MQVLKCLCKQLSDLVPTVVLLKGTFLCKGKVKTLIFAVFWLPHRYIIYLFLKKKKLFHIA